MDHVLPVGADYRQWTLSFPRWLRIRWLCGKALVAEVLRIFVRAVAAFHRRRARARARRTSPSISSCLRTTPS